MKGKKLGKQSQHVRRVATKKGKKKVLINLGHRKKKVKKRMGFVNVKGEMIPDTNIYAKNYLKDQLKKKEAEFEYRREMDAQRENQRKYDERLISLGLPAKEYQKEFEMSADIIDEDKSGLALVKVTEHDDPSVFKDVWSVRDSNGNVLWDGGPTHVAEFIAEGGYFELEDSLRNEAKREFDELKSKQKLGLLKTQLNDVDNLNSKRRDLTGFKLNGFDVEILKRSKPTLKEIERMKKELRQDEAAERKALREKARAGKK